MTHIVRKPAPSSQHLNATRSSSLDHRGYCYAFSPFSLLALAVAIASTHYAYPWRHSQAELAWVPGLNTKMVYPRTVTHPRTNYARRRVTMLMETQHVTTKPDLHQLTPKTSLLLQLRKQEIYCCMQFLLLNIGEWHYSSNCMTKQ